MQHRKRIIFSKKQKVSESSAVLQASILFLQKQNPDPKDPAFPALRKEEGEKLVHICNQFGWKKHMPLACIPQQDNSHCSSSKA